MKELFDQIKSITDTLNVGRLIFYPFAGVLIVYPLSMLIQLLVTGPCRPLFAQMYQDLNASGAGLGIVLSSIVVGFLVATVGFSAVLEDVVAKVKEEIKQESANENSFSYNYPLLRQKKEEDYATWLISEYYRFVEIATYIPLGGISGFVLLELYMFAFLFLDPARRTVAGLTTVHVILVILLGVLILIKYYVWPEVWVKRVLIPVMRTYLRAKKDLIDGVKVVDKAVSLVTQHP